MNHLGCPVLFGDKWIGNKWIRWQEQVLKMFFDRFQDYMMDNFCHKINRLCNPLVPFRFLQVSTFKCLLPKEDNYKPNDIVLSGRKKERRYL